MLAHDRICLAQEPIRDVEAKGCGGFQVDPQEKLGCLHQEIARLFPFENLVYQPSRLLPLVGQVIVIGKYHVFCRESVCASRDATFNGAISHGAYA